MKAVYIKGSNIVSPLGLTTEENYSKVKSGISGVSQINDEHLYPSPFYGALIRDKQFTNTKNSRLESMFIHSIQTAMNETIEPIDKKNCLLILSTTKGNIDLLDDGEVIHEDAFLGTLSAKINTHFGFEHNAVMVSNACISGVLAINMAARYIATGRYKQVIVSGGDILSEFVVSGFSSLMALSPSLCRPYDKDRDGINIGEGCATIIMSDNPSNSSVQVLSGFSSNDANHISGPSRTGDGLFNSINQTIEYHKTFGSDIDFINAHGTATLFNDDMESRAFKLAELDQTPINSFKSYFGHTLGAAGVIESIISIESMKDNCLIKSPGYSQIGTPIELNVIQENNSKSISTVLKTASGFGGCNAAVIFQKDE